MREILKSKWNYILYEVGSEFILSVMCGSVALYDRNIYLNEEEKKIYESKGQSYIEELANKIRNNPDDYLERHVKI